MAEAKALERYQQYLEKNYDGGSRGFFAPTGFLKKFQRKIDLEVQQQRSVVFVSKIDEAVRVLEPVVAGGDGVFDLSAEPGTGKTSALPFKFPSKRVWVVEPSPFDAWSAYNMATGVCQLKLKGLTLGPSDAKVVFTDSYYGAAVAMTGGDSYDIMIVDECDTDRGVTKFLSEVKVKGKLLIRMSATIGDYGAIKESSYRVEERDSMPDIRQGVRPVADYVTRNKQKRNLVLAPSAVLAQELSELLPGSVVVTSMSKLQDLADAVVDQKGPGTFVTDDICSRGMNLNADAMFDCQLVDGGRALRPVTPSEAKQRRHRVGRNKAGWYHHSGIAPVERVPDAVSVVRNNVVRVHAGVKQAGPSSLQVTAGLADSLLCSSVEPYEVVVAEPVVSSPPMSQPGSPVFEDAEMYYPSSESSRPRSDSKRVKAPGWAHVFGGPGRNYHDAYVTKTKGGALSIGSGGSRRSSNSARSSSSSGSVSALTARTAGLSMRTAPLRDVAEGAPYAVDRARRRPVAEAVAVPASPPVMDLTALPYDMNWPGIIRDRLMSGGDLPTLVPPGDWKHTSAVGLGTNWRARLEALAVGNPEFTDSEFEVVCRAWNKLVAVRWVMATPGLSVADEQSVEFCLRYFQAHFQLASA